MTDQADKTILGFGDFLRQKREEAGLTLEKLEAMTNINIKNLENLENDRFDKLPPKIYIKGILSKYCAYVGLDIEDTLKRFDQYFVEHRDQNFTLRKNATFNVRDNQKRRRVFDINKIIIGMVLTLFGIFLIFQTSLLVLPPKIEVFVPKDETSYTDSAINITGKVMRTKSLTINAQPIAFEKGGNFEFLMALELGTNEIQIIAKNQLGRTSTVVRKVIYQKSQPLGVPPSAGQVSNQASEGVIQE